MRINNSKWNNNGKEEKKRSIYRNKSAKRAKRTREKSRKKQQQQWHTQQSTINSSALKLSFFHWRIYIPTHLLEMYNKRIAIRSYVHLIQCCALSVMLLLFQLSVCWWWWDCCCRHRIEKFFRKRRPTEKNCTQNKMRKKSTFAFIHVNAVGAQIRNHQMNSSTKEAKEKENKTK